MLQDHAVHYVKENQRNTQKIYIDLQTNDLQNCSVLLHASKLYIHKQTLTMNAHSQQNMETDSNTTSTPLPLGQEKLQPLMVRRG
jgi:hypothetical protein